MVIRSLFCDGSIARRLQLGYFSVAGCTALPSTTNTLIMAQMLQRE